LRQLVLVAIVELLDGPEGWILVKETAVMVVVKPGERSLENVLVNVELGGGSEVQSAQLAGALFPLGLEAGQWRRSKLGPYALTLDVRRCAQEHPPQYTW